MPEDRLEEIKRLTKTFPDYDGNPKYTPHTNFFGPALLTWLITELDQAREKHVRDYVFMESQTRQLLEAQAKIQELEAELLVTRRQREERQERIEKLETFVRKISDTQYWDSPEVEDVINEARQLLAEKEEK